MVTLLLLLITLPVYALFNRAKTKGIIGERMVATMLRLLGRKYITFNHLTIKSRTGQDLIDHVVLSPFGLFVIETENYRGCISGSEDSHNWTLTFRKEITETPNFVQRNQEHIRNLSQLLPQYALGHYIPIVAFTGSTSLKVKEREALNVIHIRSILPRIWKYKKAVFTDAQFKELEQALRHLLEEGGQGQSGETPKREL